MVAGNEIWEHWLERRYNLRRDKCKSHERPHKPVLLLSIIDLLDRGEQNGCERPAAGENIILGQLREFARRRA